MHFLLLVTNTDKYNLDEQLEPFDENKTVEKHIVHTKAEIIEEAKQTKARCKEMSKRHKLEEWMKKYIKAKTDEELYQLEVHDYEEYDEDGNMLSDYNPDSKWDWYTVGGRWDNWLVDRNGNGCNVCKVKDISIEKFTMQEVERQSEEYDKRIKEPKPYFYGFDHIPTKGEYIKSLNLDMVPYAVLHDGMWFEPDVDSPRDFYAFLISLDPETEITVVDCHM